MTARLAVRLRLVHPFPSILDGLVVALLASVAGASLALAATLGLSMTLLQFAIGALNDVVDAPRDRERKPGKPIPAGIISLATARLVAVSCATAGLMLATVGGMGLVLLAIAGLAIGATYDLAAKGTALSWLPLTLGIPLLPVYAWYGAVGTLPAAFVIVLPVAALAGTALAIANALVDVERDAAAGDRSIALFLGARRAAAAGLAVQLLVAGLAVLAALEFGSPAGGMAALGLAAAVPVAGAIVGLRAAGRPDVRLREVAWEVQAVGIGLLAVAWLLVLQAGEST